MIWALLLGAAPLDPVGAPLKLYLSDTDVTSEVRRLEPMLRKCATAEDATVGLHLELQPQGGIKLVRLDEAEAGLTSCVREAVSGAASPAHKGSTIRVATTLYIRDQAVVISPSPTIHKRDMGPLMLFIPGDDADREAVTSHLNGPAADKR